MLSSIINLMNFIRCLPSHTTPQLLAEHSQLEKYSDYAFFFICLPVEKYNFRRIKRWNNVWAANLIAWDFLWRLIIFGGACEINAKWLIIMPRNKRKTIFTTRNYFILKQRNAVAFNISNSFSYFSARSWKMKNCRGESRIFCWFGEGICCKFHVIIHDEL